jgi:hypothetical protein
MNIAKLSGIILFSVLFCHLSAQKGSDQIFVDDNGVMRWSEDSIELHGFGVNYTLPFAYEYRMAKRAGLPLEELIKQDVYHMARLDLDLYRVHVWDTEISDTLGNLLDNDHLRLFDFTVSEMKKRGMRFIITPIAYWGNGWPEADEPTPGFSCKYGKDACLTNARAIEAQANYLIQFLNHVNPFTGKAYKEDNCIIGFEVCNEPHHSGSGENVTAFINKMVASMRQTGCTKPVFYNMSHSIYLADAYLKANIQGGTFQWYPTNLVAGHQINGNFLPHVETYPIPFANEPAFKKMAKIIYEFDPADVGGNILYPAMACAFRKAGMQFGAQFAYDALFGASANTNYGTHYMNLAYAPQKALSLKIASAVFHYMPVYSNEKPEALRISYTDDLAEWVSNEKFFYSNNTSSQPSDLSKLKEIAGYGSSPLVKYSGTGAYFLDKISEGLWRLEVMPDAYWIEDPYGPVAPGIQKAAVVHAMQKMTVALPDLGQQFFVRPVNKGNTFYPAVTGGQMELMPGVYLLRHAATADEIAGDQTFKNSKIGEYVAPESNLSKTILWNHSPAEAIADKPVQITFEAVSPSPVKKIPVVLSNGGKWKTMEAVTHNNRSYSLTVPSDMVTKGFLQYRIMVEDSRDTTTFPNGRKGDPWNSKNRDNAAYTIRLVPEGSPLVLWDAAIDWEYTYKIWNRSVDLKPTNDDETALAIQLTQFPAADPVNVNERSYAFKYFFGGKIKGRIHELSAKKYMVVKVTNELPAMQSMEIGLIDKNGSVIAGKISVRHGEKIFRIALANFTSAPFLIIPRPFPEFLPYSVQPENEPFDWSSAEVLQVVVKPGEQDKADLNIEKIWLE